MLFKIVRCLCQKQRWQPLKCSTQGCKLVDKPRGDIKVKNIHIINSSSEIIFLSHRKQNKENSLKTEMFSLNIVRNKEVKQLKA